MAYNYEAGTATDVADWFTKLEAFMLTLGWTIESGSGTQTIVFKSIGEGGARTKLHCRFRQNGGSPNEVLYRVQDDVAGTHATTEGSVAEALDAGGGGAAPFDYWMCGDRDCVNVVFLTGGAYTGGYVGIVERFAVTVPDEEYEMVACTPNRFNVNYCGQVLRHHDGTWDGAAGSYSYINAFSTYQKNPLDNSYMLAGIYITEHYHTLHNDDHVGQLKHISASLGNVAGLNAQDTIATGFGGATSWWTVFGTLTDRWALHTGGTLPVGAWEGGFSSTSGTATDINDLNTKLQAFLVSLGWSVVANPSPVFALDYYLNTLGQLGGDDFWMRMRYDSGSAKSYSGYVMDDASDLHHTSYLYGRAYPGEFPMAYFIVGDGDCFLLGLERASVWYWQWYGIYTLYMGDPSAIATPYKAGGMDGPPSVSTQYKILRSFDGSWLGNCLHWTDRFANSSPNTYDGTSYIVWPTNLYNGAGPWPVGQPKYLHRLGSVAIAVNDTVTIGSRRYTYLGEDFAYRDT